VRHAQAAGKGPQDTDKNRALTPAGITEAHKAGRYLAKLPHKPQQILASAATRTRQTAQIIATELAFPAAEIQFLDALYECATDDLLSAIHTLEHTCHCALIVGHNPGVSYLANHLSNQAVDGLVAAGMVGLEFAVSEWTQLQPAEGRLEFSVNPSMIEL
jgi:phosphohistidine phosphatase